LFEVERAVVDSLPFTCAPLFSIQYFTIALKTYAHLLRLIAPPVNTHLIKLRSSSVSTCLSVNSLQLAAFAYRYFSDFYVHTTLFSVHVQMILAPLRLPYSLYNHYSRNLNFPLSNIYCCVASFGTSVLLKFPFPLPRY
jgi:hypothetical protein